MSPKTACRGGYSGQENSPIHMATGKVLGKVRPRLPVAFRSEVSLSRPKTTLRFHVLAFQAIAEQRAGRAIVGEMCRLAKNHKISDERVAPNNEHTLLERRRAKQTDGSIHSSPSDGDVF